jgi:hypothetical protein
VEGDVGEGAGVEGSGEGGDVEGGVDGVAGLGVGKGELEGVAGSERDSGGGEGHAGGGVVAEAWSFRKGRMRVGGAGHRFLILHSVEGRCSQQVSLRPGRDVTRAFSPQAAASG